MSKKKDTIKNLLSYISVAIVILGLVTGFVRFQVMAEDTAKDTKTIKEDIEKVKKETDEEIEKVKEETEKDIKEIKEDKQELDKVVVEQTIKLQYIQQSLDKSNEAIREILQEVKKKK